jgi:hypothetical protein
MTAIHVGTWEASLFQQSVKDIALLDVLIVVISLEKTTKCIHQSALQSVDQKIIKIGFIVE